MIIEALHTILANTPEVFALVGDRVYPVTMPDAPQYPLIVITKAGGQDVYDMDGYAELESARVQVDCWSDRGAADVIGLKMAVKRKLRGFKGSVDSAIPCQIQAMFCINDFDLSEPATERAGPKVRRRVLEFNIWSKEV